MKKPSKFASFLTLLGIIVAAGLAGLTYFFQTMVLEGMAQGGTLDGNSVYMDNVFDMYTWRLTATLELGYAVYALAAAAGLSFISLFMRGD